MKKFVMFAALALVPTAVLAQNIPPQMLQVNPPVGMNLPVYQINAAAPGNFRLCSGRGEGNYVRQEG